MNGPAGPRRRWAWTETTRGDVARIRAAFGGSVNDVVLAAITAGLRDVLASRGTLGEGALVRSVVPVSLHARTARVGLNNQLTVVFVDLPVHEPSPTARLAALRMQMDAHKRILDAVHPRTTAWALDVVAPPLLALGSRILFRSHQIWVQAITTNVPGPRVPLYVLGRRMTAIHPYVPICAGLRISIGAFSYLDVISFGITVDYDAGPDVDVLANGIARGLADLVTLTRDAPPRVGGP